MQRLEVSGAVRPIYGSLGVKRLIYNLSIPTTNSSKREWRQLHNEELNDLNTATNIFQVIKSRRMKWAGHVTRMERRGEESSIQGIDGKT